MYRSIAERWDMTQVYRELLSREERSRKYFEVWDHVATTQTQTNPAYPHRPNAKHFGAAGGSQTSTNPDTPQTSKNTRLTLSPGHGATGGGTEKANGTILFSFFFRCAVPCMFHRLSWTGSINTQKGESTHTQCEALTTPSLPATIFALSLRFSPFFFLIEFLSSLTIRLSLSLEQSSYTPSGKRSHALLPDFLRTLRRNFTLYEHTLHPRRRPALARLGAGT